MLPFGFPISQCLALSLFELKPQYRSFCGLRPQAKVGLHGSGKLFLDFFETRVFKRQALVVSIFLASVLLFVRHSTLGCSSALGGSWRPPTPTRRARAFS